MFTSPGAIALQTGFITIYWYGIFIALAFITGVFICQKIAQKKYKNFDSEKFSDLIFFILIGAILGARIYYVVFNWQYFNSNLPEIFMTWHGGMSIHGAIIGGFITGSLFVKKHKMPLWMYADILAFGLPIGQAIGRWGNFFNSEAFGKPTESAWKLYVPEINRPLGFENFQYFHPTFLYESVWNILVFCILYFGLRKYFQNNYGGIFFSYLVLYSIGRLLIEPIRIDSIFNPLGVPIAIWASLIMSAIGITGLIIINKRKKETAK